jgi:hypothetical protein
MNCIVILGIKIDRKLEKFLYEIKKKHPEYDFYIFLDDEEKKCKPKYKDVKIIQLSHLEITKKGYKDILLRYYHVENKNQKSFAPDKALYYFSTINEKKYSYYWFLEDDVLIPHIDTIKNLDKKYKNQDLLVSNIGENKGDNFDWHWSLMLKNNRNRKKEIRIDRAKNSNNYYFEPPWYSSWASIFRCSHDFILSVENFVKKNKTMVFGEIFLVTLCKKNNLKVGICKEFKMRYKYKSRKNSLWELEELNKDCLFTVIKSKRKQEEFRKNFRN